MTAPWHLTAAEMDAAWDALAARLAEVERLLQEVYDGRQSLMSVGLVYRIGHTLNHRPADSASVQPVKYGCHCDIENMPDGYEPDACVMDDGLDDMCVYARQLRRDGKDKTSCSYWKPIKAAASQPEDAGK